jgi:hypothetical protein
MIVFDVLGHVVVGIVSSRDCRHHHLDLGVGVMIARDKKDQVEHDRRQDFEDQAATALRDRKPLAPAAGCSNFRVAPVVEHVQVQASLCSERSLWRM